MVTTGSASRLPLDGVRCLEFGFGIAAPAVGRNLAHYGADVIRVESRRRPDSLRQAGAGWVPLDTDITVRGDTGAMLNASSPQKRSLGLEVGGPRGPEVLARLLPTCDIFVSNLSAGALPAMGLSYDEVRRYRPDVIYVNTTAFGTAPGPYRDYRTWGPNLSAISGVDGLVGWPDRGPVNMAISYPDFIVAYHATVATLAALLRRDLTGEGAHVEMSQFEAMTSGIGPIVLDAAVTGRVQGPAGNRDPVLVPQGIYPTRDMDRWVAISVPDERWRALCSAMGAGDLAADAELDDLAVRQRRHDEIDDRISAWTATRTGEEAAADLQRVGIAAAPVYGPMDTGLDRHLEAREFWRVAPSTRFRADLLLGHAVRLTGTPPVFDHASPALGEHTAQVLAELGYSDADVAAMAEEGTAYLMGPQDAPLERPYLHWIGNVMRLAWPPASLQPAQIMFERLNEGSDGE